ncbi:TetR/AcrR family transcriptional regulator [Streptacidiphilus sp. N1-3]|uniref:TetR/AcrR family transcriptional regulator n=1 Tax=Streptacidiphilus alkalitolerans TaxID=3342712 RepID=A0ABV6X696_9ACTN
MDASTPARKTAGPAPRGRNPRGQGERLHAEIVGAAVRLLDQLADDQALSLRAVAREVGIAATSVYIHFADRDALVLAALEHCYAGLLRAVDEAESGAADPVAALRARTALLGAWGREHPGLYKVLHESTLDRRRDMSFRDEMSQRTTAAVRRCMDAGLAPRADPETVSLDLRTAVHGAVSLRLNQPELPWPPLEQQVERFLTKLVGIPPLEP